jgi:hypothetical protein
MQGIPSVQISLAAESKFQGTMGKIPPGDYPEGSLKKKRLAR